MLAPSYSFVVFGSLVIRLIIGLWGYSGSLNPPLFGDFEAQRHWMEVTTGLNIGDW